MSETKVWRKSMRSASENLCVETFVAETHTEIRDSKNPAGETLAVTASTWTTFLTHLKTG